MAWNGAGVFSRIHNWAADALAGIKILASRHDAEDDNLSTGINNCLTKNGENNPSANLPMGGFKHTNVANATARDSYASAGQVQDGSLVYAVDSGAADAYVISLSPAITAYAAGQKFTFKATNANTGASTLNVNALGVKTIKKHNDQDLAAGDIEAGQIVEVEYDGTNLQMLSQLGNAPTSGISNVVEDTTPQLGGALDTNGKAINESEGAAVASATTTNIFGGDDGNTIHITGTTTITDFTDASSVGQWRKLIFDGVLTLTHGSGITLPGSANITTAVGDIAFVYADAVDAFRVAYFRADGTAIVSSGGGSGSAKAWADIDMTGTAALDNNFNVTSINDDGTGLVTVTWDTDFANANYVCVGMTSAASAGNDEGLVSLIPASRAVGSAQFQTVDVNNTADNTDYDPVMIVAFGDQ